jgi:hypothetical protein
MDGISKAEIFEIVFESNRESTLRTVNDHLKRITDSLNLKFLETESNYKCIKEVKFKINDQEITIS